MQNLDTRTYNFRRNNCDGQTNIACVVQNKKGLWLNYHITINVLSYGRPKVTCDWNCSCTCLNVRFRVGFNYSLNTCGSLGPNGSRLSQTLLWVHSKLWLGFDSQFGTFLHFLRYSETRSL